VVEHDPTLLSNQEYVRRNNPQIGSISNQPSGDNAESQFLSVLRAAPRRKPRAGCLAEYTIKEAPRTAAPPLPPPPLTGWKLLAPQVVPFALFVCVLGAMLWLFRQFVENRRWSRIFNLQTEVHNKLIDRFGSSQELLAYMNSEAGRRFLEAEPLSVNLERKEHIGDETARISCRCKSASCAFPSWTWLFSGAQCRPCVAGADAGACSRSFDAWAWVYPVRSRNLADSRSPWAHAGTAQGTPGTFRHAGNERWAVSRDAGRTGQ